MKKFKVVVTDYNYQNIDIELVSCHCRTEEEVIALGSDCDVLVVQFAPITRKVIESLTQCKMIIGYAIGVDNIDLKAATEKGIYVATVPDYGIDEVSTHAVALRLAIRTCNGIDYRQVKLARIKNTLSMGEIEVSQALYEQIAQQDNIEYIAGPYAMCFDEQGMLR